LSSGFPKPAYEESTTMALSSRRKAQIGKHDAVRLMDRIGVVEESVLQRARCRFARSFEDRSVAAKALPMIAAADPFLADQPELERSTAMRTMQFKKADLTPSVAEREQILAQVP
jgi:hypothetical protein